MIICLGTNFGVTHKQNKQINTNKKKELILWNKTKTITIINKQNQSTTIHPCNLLCVNIIIYLMIL